jgi:hypothetical protein
MYAPLPYENGDRHMQPGGQEKKRKKKPLVKLFLAL